MYYISDIYKDNITPADFNNMFEIFNDNCTASPDYFKSLIDQTDFILLARESSSENTENDRIIGMLLVLYGYNPQIGWHYNLSHIYLDEHHQMDSELTMAMFSGIAPIIEAKLPPHPVHACISFRRSNPLPYLDIIARKFQFSFGCWHEQLHADDMQLVLPLNVFLERARKINQTGGFTSHSIWAPKLYSQDGVLEKYTLENAWGRFIPAIIYQKPVVDETASIPNISVNAQDYPAYLREALPLDDNTGSLSSVIEEEHTVSHQVQTSLETQVAPILGNPLNWLARMNAEQRPQGQGQTSLPEVGGSCSTEGGDEQTFFTTSILPRGNHKNRPPGL